jgi:opacity protein-like surface antigen
VEFSFGGLYLGANFGAVWNNTCADWTPERSGAQVADFIYKCPDRNAFTGGVTAGYNFMNFLRAGTLLGLEADYSGWSKTSETKAVDYRGAAIPPGVYKFSGETSPGGVSTVRLRWGFVTEELMPYLTGGFAYASGSPSSRIAYTPVGATSPSATFSGTNTLGTSGWTVGGGFEYGFARHFSMKIEYLYMQFSHSARHPQICGGPDCTIFTASDVGFLSHDNGRVHMARVGFNYLFEGP